MLFRQFLDPRSFSFRKVAETTCMCQIFWSVLQHLFSYMYMYVYVVCMSVYTCMCGDTCMYVVACTYVHRPEVDIESLP